MKTASNGKSTCNFIEYLNNVYFRNFLFLMDIFVCIFQNWNTLFLGEMRLLKWYDTSSIKANPILTSWILRHFRVFLFFLEMRSVYKNSFKLGTYWSRKRIFFSVDLLQNVLTADVCEDFKKIKNKKTKNHHRFHLEQYNKIFSTFIFSVQKLVKYASQK